jgi:hypothetical protein
MTRAFDFEVPDLSAKQFVKDLLFIKTRDSLFYVAATWFLLSIFYLFIVHFYTFYLFASLKLVQSVVYYVSTMSVYFFSRIILGYILEWV